MPYGTKLFLSSRAVSYTNILYKVSPEQKSISVSFTGCAETRGEWSPSNINPSFYQMCLICLIQNFIMASINKMAKSRMRPTLTSTIPISTQDSTIGTNPINHQGLPKKVRWLSPKVSFLISLLCQVQRENLG